MWTALVCSSDYVIWEELEAKLKNIAHKIRAFRVGVCFVLFLTKKSGFDSKY